MSSNSGKEAAPKDPIAQGIRRLMTDLDHFRKHFAKGVKLPLTHERLDRWKKRTKEYLRENISAGEAYEFGKIGDKAIASAWNPTKEIENYMAYLRAFCEDRESRAQLTSTRQTRSEIREESKVNDVSLNFLHPKLIEKCADHFRNKKFDEVILNACKVVEVYTRERASLRASDIGVPLMRKVFRPNPPILKYSDDKGEQEALMHLFSGFIGVFKNPQSHRFVNVKDPLVAFEILVFADRLCKILEQTQFQIPDLGSQSTTNKSGSNR